MRVSFLSSLNYRLQIIWIVYLIIFMIDFDLYMRISLLHIIYKLSKLSSFKQSSYLINKTDFLKYLHDFIYRWICSILLYEHIKCLFDLRKRIITVSRQILSSEITVTQVKIIQSIIRLNLLYYRVLLLK